MGTVDGGALETKPVIWTTDDALEVTSLSGYGLGAPGDDASMRGQSIATLAPGDGAVLLEAGEIALTGEVEVRTANIAGVAHTVTMHPIVDRSGSVTGTVGVAIVCDTSPLGFSEELPPRIEALTRLEESEERHRILVESAPYCIHEINNKGCLTSMNPAGLTMMGVEEESAIVGLRYLDIIVEADRARIAHLLSRALEGHISMFEFEATNGQFFHSNFVPIVDAEGKVVRMMGLTQNITEQKLAERALVASEQRLELALQGGELGLWDLDLGSGELIFNDRWAGMSGLDPAQVPRRRSAWTARVHPEELAEVQARLDAHLRGDTAYYVSEHRVRAGDGQWRWIHEHGTIVARDQSGAPLRVTGTSQDLTDRHHAEDERRKLEAQLLQSQKMESIGQLAGGVAHDFNNLLVAILGHAELAALNLVDDIDIADNLDEIRRAAERAAELTRRLLAFSRQQRIELHPVDLNQCVEALLRMLGRLLPESMHIELALAPDLPDVSADAAQLEQVIMNLCVNARDAMPDGGVLTVSTCLRAASEPDAPDMVVLRIQDAGEGMDASVRARIFEPFFTTKSAEAGTGLGLSMVYGIVKQHRGNISVNSSPGEGSTFVIELPVASAGDQPRAADQQAANMGRGETILVAEDEELVRKLVVSVLERSGYRVLVAEDGWQAIELFERHIADVSLVLMDAVMPRLGGRRAHEKLLAIEPNVKVVITSGYLGEGASPESPAPDTPLLAKPYSMDALLHTVREVLDAPRPRA